jgi:hypothetical protein
MVATAALLRLTLCFPAPLDEQQQYILLAFADVGNEDIDFDERLEVRHAGCPCSLALRASLHLRSAFSHKIR